MWNSYGSLLLLNFEGSISNVITGHITYLNQSGKFRSLIDNNWYKIQSDAINIEYLNQIISNVRKNLFFEGEIDQFKNSNFKDTLLSSHICSIASEQYHA